MRIRGKTIVMTHKDKVAIVTGAGQGIGFEISRRLAAAGARVVLNDLDRELGHEAAEKIASEGGKCIAVAGDSSDDVIIERMIQSAVSNYGKLDIAIANSGITRYGDFLEFKREAFEEVMKVNLAGTFFLAQRATVQMKSQGTPGSLLFMSSVTGHQAHKKLAAYSMSKAAIEMLARNLVTDISKFGVTVNTIAPGATLTERTLEDPTYESFWNETTPTGRAATVKDIADAALFLVSDAARHITGQTLVVDGGWTCISPSPD